MRSTVERESGGLRFVAEHDGARYETFVAVSDWRLNKIRNTLRAEADQLTLAADALGVDEKALALEVVGHLQALVAFVTDWG